MRLNLFLVVNCNESSNTWTKLETEECATDTEQWIPVVRGTWTQYEAKQIMENVKYW